MDSDSYRVAYHNLSGRVMSLCSKARSAFCNAKEYRPGSELGQLMAEWNLQEAGNYIQQAYREIEDFERLPELLPGATDGIRRYVIRAASSRLRYAGTQH